MVGGGGLAVAGKWLGDGLSWASREVAKHQEASRAAPVDRLRRLLFPPVDVSDARAGGCAATSGPSASAQRSTEDAQRAELLGGGFKVGTMTARERVDARRAAHRAARDGGGAAGSVAGAQSAISESLEAMNERGEKINELGDKSAQLADDAEDFANLAKQLRRQQEKGIFGGLF